VSNPSLRPGASFACLLLAAACTPQSFELTREQVAGVADGPRISHDPPPGTAGRMAHHFADVRAIEEAVIAGDLYGVRSPARRLVERTDPYPESWRPYMAGNLRLAEAALAARNLEDAARAAAGLVDNCGECHAAVGLGPALVAAGLPPSDPEAPSTMLRHQWAADRLRDALLTRGDPAWRAGAEALAGAPLRASALPAEVNDPAQFDALATRVHELGGRARTSAAWPARADIYGELLTTCAACHRGLVASRTPYIADSTRRAEAE